MQVDRKTGMVTIESREEATQWLHLMEQILIQGVIEWEHPFIKHWIAVAGFDEPTKQTLAATVVMPQKVLLSLVHWLWR